MIESLNTLAVRATGMDISPSSMGGVSLENPRNSLSKVFDIEPTFTGRSVTPFSALSVSAVWACVRIIAGTVAKTPRQVFRRTPDGKVAAPDHYLSALFGGSANPRMSSFRFFRLMQCHQLLWGNAFAEMEINGRGQIVALWPMRPDRMRIVQNDDGSVVYVYQPVGQGLQQRVIDEHHMFHLRGLETDGLIGLSPISQARQAVSLAMAAEEYGARFFGNNARPGIVLEHPNALSDKARANLVKSWEQIHKGLQGAHRVGVLEEGMKIQEIGIPPEDAQFLQTRQFQIVEICRWYGVQPHKVAELSKSTNNNIEQQSLEFVQDTMEDHFCNWEAETSHTLLSQREAPTIFVSFARSKLLRGDFKSRADGLATLRQNGFINGDEGRDDLGLNPIADGSGKKYIVQLNMQDLDKVGEEPPAEPIEEPAEPSPAPKPAPNKEKR
jgi:HK97 family phage portal protein